MDNFLKTLSDSLDKSGVKSILFGGFALPLYGVERFTFDIDFMIAENDFEIFSKSLICLGYRLVLRTEQFARFRNADKDYFDIDTVFVGHKSFEKMLELSEKKRIGSADFLCASLDILLGTKLHAIKYNEEKRGARDFEDIVNLIKANNIKVADKNFIALCNRYGTGNIYTRICAALSKK